MTRVKREGMRMNQGYYAYKDYLAKAVEKGQIPPSTIDVYKNSTKKVHPKNMFGAIGFWS